MTRHIGQNLLKDAEDCCGPIGRGIDMIRFTRQFTLYSGPLRELARLPSQRWNEAEIIENRGPQLSAELPYTVSRRMNDGLHLSDFVQQWLSGCYFCFQAAAHPRQSDFDSCKHRSETVMQLIRDTDALFLPVALEPGSKNPQAFSLVSRSPPGF